MSHVHLDLHCNLACLHAVDVVIATKYLHVSDPILEACDNSRDNSGPGDKSDDGVFLG